ncbi:ATP-binding cassette domain-containing protein [Lactobacillus panisapium]|uniref:ATP-binding cassette domain-containing protein n=1 Tax=Lactobacillus panisapium TaxID=2012495 RepID=UPI001C69E7E6|nr:ATP-binding cassette domain-containing protein [Lactobacillus panisapium]QYN59370.1 ATP-binding cassette domain-containing protein [Lactobacillus panisapium]
MKLEFKNMNIIYNNNKIIFNNFNGEIRLNNLNVIIGKNGIGKTTMLDAISGLIKLKKGSITGLPKQKDIMYVIQSIPFFDEVTVKQLIQMYDSFGRKRSYEIINDSGSENFYNSNIKPLLSSTLGVLSGGEKKLVFDYASAMVLKSLYLFDEPLSGVDIENQKKIVKMLENFALFFPVIITSHDIEPFKNINCTLKYITPTKFLFSGSYDNLMEEAGGTSESAFLNLTQRMRENERSK